MKLAMLTILITGLIFVAGCPTITGGPEKPDYSNMTPKEIAAFKARQIHGENKPYTYEWKETAIIDGKEYIKQGKALVVPGEPYTGKDN